MANKSCVPQMLPKLDAYLEQHFYEHKELRVLVSAAAEAQGLLSMKSRAEYG
jgi:hypothetical protein